MKIIIEGYYDYVYVYTLYVHTRLKKPVRKQPLGQSDTYYKPCLQRRSIAWFTASQAEAWSKKRTFFMGVEIVL